MKREFVYKLIDGERDYQDSKWGSFEENPKQVGAWLTLLRYLLFRAEEEWSTTRGDHSSLDEIRKLVASGVACLEQHGAPPRGCAADRNGFRIYEDQSVLVHQDDGVRKGTVHEVTDSYTVNEPGYWVDVCIDNQGPEGIPSYMLEIVDEANEEPEPMGVVPGADRQFQMFLTNNPNVKEVYRSVMTECIAQESGMEKGKAESTADALLRRVFGVSDVTCHMNKDICSENC